MVRTVHVNLPQLLIDIRTGSFTFLNLKPTWLLHTISSPVWRPLPAQWRRTHRSKYEMLGYRSDSFETFLAVSVVRCVRWSHALLTMVVQMYVSGHTSASKALLFVTDIFGVPLLENQLLADSLAANDYLVVMPDLFKGDAISVEEQEAGLNLTEWRALHPTPEIDSIINTTIGYLRSELNVERIGGLGYCFGGKYVPRFLTASGGIDIGFIAHPSSLTEAEIGGVTKGLSIAAGSKFPTFLN